MRRHLVNCSKAAPTSQLHALKQQAQRAGSHASQSCSQSNQGPDMDTYIDRVRVTPRQKETWWYLLAVAFIMTGWSIQTVENPQFIDFMAHVRPNFELPSAYTLSGVCIDAALAVVKLKQHNWLQDAAMAYHLTLTLDGWSNDRMESIYSWNIIFPSRKVILLRADDLSSISHTGESLSESVVRLQSALQEIASQQASLLSKEALNIINDDMFFVRLKQICRLLEPFSLVIAAVQAARATLADVMRYWLHLAKSVTGSSSDCLPPAFKAHCFVAYNLRHKEMVSPLCKLAFFLHPLYRDVVSNDKKNWIEVQMTAGNMWKSGYKYRKQQVQQLMEDIKRYKIHEEPYDCMPVDGELATLKLYWKVILSTGSNLELPKLAVLLLDMQLIQRRLAVKPVRTVEDIMQNEQDLANDVDRAATEKAKAEADAILMAMNASTHEPMQPQLVDHATVVNTADSMELCSTAELIELFEGYTAADVKQKKDDYFVSETSCTVDLDFNHAAIDESLVASAAVSTTPLARAELGDSNEDYDLSTLVSPS
ncbi:TPA: hypothetical protein ACH3X3_007637 [Trebouxia sp. C0006]